MKKCPSEEMLLKLTENELDEREASLVKTHVLTCERCRRVLAEYRETLLLLAEERISEPDPAEWQRLMTLVRATARARARLGKRSALTERLGQKGLAWPAWSKATAIAATAALVFLVLWNAGVVDLDRFPGGIRRTAARNEKAASTGEKYAADVKTSHIAERKLAEDTTARGPASLLEDAGTLLSDRVFSGSDSTSLDLAGLTDEEFYDISELSTSLSALGDYDLLLVDLTDEEQAELLKELESSFSM